MSTTHRIAFPFPITFLPTVLLENERVIGPYMLKQLMIAVRDDLDEIVLFAFKNTDYVAKIVKADYENRLNELKAYFIAQEQYENAGRVDRTLRQHHANILIAETRIRKE